MNKFITSFFFLNRKDDTDNSCVDHVGDRHFDVRILRTCFFWEKKNQVVFLVFIMITKNMTLFSSCFIFPKRFVQRM